MKVLPVPGRTRWQPLRAGLVDLFYYDVEEFWFHDGRLLLRGNNGTGKSKVLALLLPFLFDGDLSAHRVEPDADPKKRMEWNLLLGGEHPHAERLGYTWLEFGRVDADGRAEFRTIGCGLKAVAGRGIARHWFFTTDQRIGSELELVDATRTALSRERLADALAGHGVVHDKARDYRRAIDEALFGLGEQRYGALVDLLVQLRQPQLSKRPSERALSDALTESLPPIDQAVVADVAEAFRSLEEDRDELVAMTEAHASAQAFLGHYRRYAAVAARRRAEQPRRAEQRYRSAREALAAAEQAHREADAAAATAQERLDELARDTDRLRARDQVLRASPEMRSAEELDRRAGEARRRRADADAATTSRDRAATTVGQRLDRRTTAGRRAVAAATELGDGRAGAVRDAAEARMGSGHGTDIDARIPEAVDAEAVDQQLSALRRAAEALVGRQQRALAHVDALRGADVAAAKALGDARAAVERLATAAAELAARRDAAAGVVERCGAELVADTRAHLDTAVELRVPEPDAALAALELWCSTLDRPNPARVAADIAGRAVTAALAGVGAALQQSAAEAQRRATDNAAEIARLEAGEHGAPPLPHTRDPQVRAGRAGAPLWQLVDFQAGVDPAACAALEAALEASGVLDAWLAPDGVLRSVEGDVLLAPEPAVARPAAPLSALLRPAIDPDDPPAAAVSEAAVTAVLAAIGAGPDAGGSTWVTTDGRFRLGVLAGAWSKPVAQFIGRGAREAARRARLVDLRAEAELIAAEQARIRAAQEALATRRATLAGELAALPDDSALRAAHAAVVALGQEHARLAAERAEADDRLDDAAGRAATAHDALHIGAADVDLPADQPGLDAVRGALASYRVTLAGLWPAVKAVADTRRAEADTVAELAAAEAEHAAADAHAAATEREALAAAEAFATLRDTVGAAVDELQRLLAAAADALSANELAHRQATAARERAVADRGKAEGLRQGAEVGLAEATVERAAAAEALRRFAATGLLAVALPALELPDPAGSWAPDPTVRLARQIDQELEATSADDGSWDRSQRRVTDELKILADTLARQGNTASAQLLEDGIVVEVVFRGRPATVVELSTALGVEVADRQRLLDEREREILENHLVNEVASTLQELIAEADRQVRLMNSELSERPTSTGMRLRLEWRPREDGPAGLAEARKRLLRQTSDAWSAGDRAAVGGFLQARIAEVRSRDETGTWLEHLTTALDYRAWHRFVIERHQNGQWRPATGPASGGERVLAASVPLFAAASAHYASAGNPHAPRLVTLDEAFAGVDDNARAKYLGLLAAFDLDVVMTSEREWGCYPEVPGLAIAQLARTDGVAAVLVTHWRWDGEQRSRFPRPAAVPEPVAATAAATGSLFDDL